MKNNLDYLLSPEAIRERTRAIFELTKEGKTSFSYHPEKLPEVVDLVISVIQKNYPDLNVPYHSRWGHFRAGGVKGGATRLESFEKRISDFDPHERARIKIDLVIPSVLLDAGAGMKWKYQEKETGKEFSKSEGLGVASFHLFLSGAFSDQLSQPLLTKGKTLQKIETSVIEKSFQVSEQNPLHGVEGRTLLLKNLGDTLQKNKTFFKDSRPGNLVDYFLNSYGKKIKASHILRAILDSLGPIWPGRIVLDGVNLGDVWSYSKAPEPDFLVPFHKLSQWLTYSLIEPLMEGGFEVSGVEELTGLAEYRNGGLILDSGLIQLKNTSLTQEKFKPSDDLVIEWRALTVALLDILGEKIQKKLGKTSEEFPLAKVLEGGTWWAGRKLASEQRADGGPPLQIQSDGTVF